jgi:UDP-N-acetylmuramoylalanine--D-glutamate ligase
MEFRGKKVLVLGMARSGLAAAEALTRHGAVVTACDIKSRDKIGEDIINQVEQTGAVGCWGKYPQVNQASFDIVMPSPGVPLDIEPVLQARSLNIPVMGEVELAYRLKKPGVKIYAITGTNGKTTTTSLLHFILSRDGRQSAAGGNIGVPLTGLIENMPQGEIAVEISSFQLATTISFHPHIAGILNITPDHLDRHKSLEAYIEAKARVFANQNEDDFTVLNYEDNNLRQLAAICKAQVVFFSTERVLDQGAFIENGQITVKINNQKVSVCPVGEIKLRGRHNMENILCAAAMALAAGVRPDALHKALVDFKGIRHRMEEVGVKKGVLYINDSKGTNPESTIKAIESFTEPLVLILGGRSKGSDFGPLARLVSKRVKELIVLGEARSIIKQAVMETGFTNINEVDSFEAAVAKAADLARPGDVVLMSPACASWDMFDNYEQRGDLFCELVQAMRD